VSLLYTGTLSSQNVSYVDAWQDGNDIVINFFLDEPAFVNITCTYTTNKETHDSIGKKIKIVDNHYCDCYEDWCTYRWKTFEEYDLFDVNNFTFKVETVQNAKEEQESDYKFFILPTYHYARAPQHAYGLMLGLVDKAGVYLKVHSSFQFQKDYYKNCYSAFSFLDGKVKRPEIAGYGGLIFRTWKPLYIRMGLGYGYKSVLYHLSESEEWIEEKKYTYMGLGFDCGFMLKIKRLAVSVGTNTIHVKEEHKYKFGTYIEFNTGVGLIF
jgi:hypothetical protein